MKKFMIITAFVAVLLFASNIFALPYSFIMGQKNYSGTTSHYINVSTFRSNNSSFHFENPVGYDINGTTSTNHGEGCGGVTGVSTVPEPVTIVLFGIGLTGIALRRRKAN